MAKLCAVCEIDEATAECITCRNCRAYIHRWANEPDDRLIGHFDKLRTRVRRVTTFAVIKDERVRHIDLNDLQEKRLLKVSKKEMQRQARATVVSIKVAQSLRSQQIRSIVA